MSASSTSSSEAGRRRRIGRAALLALLLLLATEGTLAWLEAEDRLPDPKEWNGALWVRQGLGRVRATPDTTLIVTGNSVANRLEAAILAEELEGLRSEPVVAGIAAASSTIVRMLAERVFFERPRLETLVVVTDTQGLNEAGLRRNEEAGVRAEITTQLEEPLGTRLSFWLKEHVHLYRHQHLLRRLLRRPWTVELADGRPAAPAAAGSWTLEDTPWVYRAEKDLRVGPRAREDLRALAAACRARAVDLVLVIPPLPEGYDGYWKDAGWSRFEAYREELRRLARELEVPLVDLHGATPWPRELFDDSHHLAPEGAERASRLLGRRLREVLR